MTTTVRVLYDGTVLRPDTPLELEPNVHYMVTIEPETEEDPVTQEAWDIIEQLIGTVDAPPDWSVEHDHYLYGTPKRYPESAS